MEIKNMGSKKIIFIAGLGATGSSAVIDLLKEVKSYFVFENEFRLFVDPGGLLNLHDAIVRNWSIYQTDVAIKNYKNFVKAINSRFKSPYSTLGHNKYLDDELIMQTKRYTDNLIELEYIGLWYGIDHLIKRQLYKFKWFTRQRFISHPIYVAKQLSDADFNEITGDYINSLVDYCLKKYNADHFCFNENFSCMFPTKILNMVPESKMIIVIRDPRDVYATAVKNKWPAAPFRKEDFLKWELAIFNRWMNIQEKLNKLDPTEKKYKVIKFEELIEDYDRLLPQLLNFCGAAKADHKEKKKFLIPERSIKNVGLWKSTLKENEAENIFKSFRHFYDKYNYMF
jgi:hypothetical protein